MLLLFNHLSFKILTKFGFKKISFKYGNVKYMVVQQRFTKADDIGQFTIKEFDITR